MALPFMASAYTNHIQDGMSWVIEVYGTQDSIPEETIKTIDINGAIDIDGITSLQMYETTNNDLSTRQLIAYIRTEGDKVFFKRADAISEEWNLMYDFGLNIGDGCYVCDLGMQRRTYVKCINIDNNNAQYGGLETLTLVEYYDNGYCQDYQLSTGVWLKGIGSVNGIIYNNFFEYDGGSSRLISATYDGKSIYNFRASGIDEAMNTKPIINIKGLMVCVNNLPQNEVVSVYTIDGKLTHQYTTLDGSAYFNVPSSGCYILKYGSKNTRIMAK